MIKEKINCSDGSYYEGEWENNMANGYGLMKYANKDVY